jgi:2,3-dihydroxybenzoate-AMP ligase
MRWALKKDLAMSSQAPMVSPVDFTPWPQELQDSYRAQGYWEGVPLGDLLRQAAHAAGNRTAIIAGNKQWTYQQLDERADQLAAGFIAQGIRAGSYVVLQMPNCGEFFEVLFALFRVGAAPVLALPSHRYSEINYFCQHTHAVAYIACDTHAHFDYRELGQRLKDEALVEKVIIAGEINSHNGCVALEALYQAVTLSAQVSIPAPSPSAVALFQLSGGTTGVPKLIPRTHDDYYYSVKASASICALTHSSVYLAVLPVMHNFPLSSPGALGVLLAGGTLVLAETGAPDVAFKLIEKHNVTITAVVPPLALAWMNAYENLRESPDRPNLASLEVLQVGGAKFSEEAAQRVTPILGCKLQQVFGMAEGLVNYTRLNDDITTILTTQGRPISPADEIRIVDDMDLPIAEGETGHLLTRGPYTIRGYFRAAEHNAKAFTPDGFYRTGDLVRMTKAGYFVVEGRAKDQINRGGEKIAAEEIENHLLAHPCIHDAALVAMPDAYLGERSCAFVVLRDSTLTTQQSPKAKDLLRFLHERGLAAYKIPDRIEFVAALPQTKFGKVDKKTLRQLIGDKLSSTELFKNSGQLKSTVHLIKPVH